MIRSTGTSSPTRTCRWLRSAPEWGRHGRGVPCRRGDGPAPPGRGVHGRAVGTFELRLPDGGPDGEALPGPRALDRAGSRSGRRRHHCTVVRVGGFGSAGQDRDRRALGWATGRGWAAGGGAWG